MKLVGIQRIKGEKDGRSYNFSVGHFVDPTPYEGVTGSRVITATLGRDVNVNELKVGNNYKVYLNRSANGRFIANPVLPE